MPNILKFIYCTVCFFSSSSSGSTVATHCGVSQVVHRAVEEGVGALLHEDVGVGVAEVGAAVQGPGRDGSGGGRGEAV